MAKAEVVAGSRVKCRGRVGDVVSVDDGRSLVTVRFDDAKAVHRNGVRDESLSEADAVVGEAEVEVLTVAAAPAEGKAATGKKPTAAQITAARKAALEKVKGEHLSAAEKEAVQDEAEAELVASAGRSDR